jgi:uncharacterized repeat protein (TIGR01451 family)
MTGYASRRSLGRTARRDRAPSASAPADRLLSRLRGVLAACATALAFASGLAAAQSVSTPPGTLVRNTATVSAQRAPGVVIEVPSNEVTIATVPARSRATAALLRAAPDSAGPQSTVGPAQCVNAGGQAVDLPPPQLIGGTIIDVSQPVTVLAERAFHGGEPVFLRVTDADQNLDAARLDYLDVEVVSAASGDRERIRLVETGANTGVFTGYVPTRTGAAVEGDCTLAVARASTLELRYVDATDASDVATASAVVDPQGTVLDARSGQPISGARIRLVDAATGQPAEVLGDDGRSRFPSEITSGGTATDAGGTLYQFPAGTYRFPLVPRAGTYRLLVEPPAGYAFPSAASETDLQQLPGAPLQLGPGAFGREYAVTSPVAVTLDLPLDALGGPLVVQISASAAQAAIGDAVQYVVTIQNSGTVPIRGIDLAASLPPGFRYASGSTRGASGAALADPAFPGAAVAPQFVIGDLAPGASTTLRFVARIGAGARAGNAVARAVARAARVQSNEAVVALRVDDDLFRTRGTIVGRLAIGECGRPGETGVADVRVYLEDGRYSVTDEDGRFHFEDVAAGVHVVQLDRPTIPEQLVAVPCETLASARDPHARTIELRAGGLHRADFQFRAAPAPSGKLTVQGAFGATPDAAAPPAPRGAGAGEGRGRGRIRHRVRRARRAQRPSDARAAGWRLARARRDPRRRSPGQREDAGRRRDRHAGRPAGGLDASSDGARGRGRGRSRRDRVRRAAGECAPRRAAVAGRHGGCGGFGRTRVRGCARAAGRDRSAQPRADLGAGDRGDGAPAEDRQPAAGSRVGAAVGGLLAAHPGAPRGREAPARRRGPADAQRRTGAGRGPRTNARGRDRDARGRALARRGDHRGRDRLVAVITDANGVEVARLARTIHYGGIPVRAELDVAASTLVADGRTRPVLAVRLYDRYGRPARPGLAGTFRVEPPNRAWADVAALRDNPLTATSPREPTWTVDSSGLVRLELEPTSRAGEAVARLNFGRVGGEDLRAWLAPATRDWVLVGIASGTAAWRNVESRAEPLPDGAPSDGYADDGRVAFFAKGRIRGDWLLTLAYDSDREYARERENVLGEIDPDRYYTLYGDATEMREDAPTSRKVYVKLERGAASALFGDFETGYTVTELSRYSRTFNGARVEGGVGALRASAFAARGAEALGRDVFQGDGTSGPYRLSSRSLIVGSDRVRIEVRDRFQSEVVVETRTLQRGLDYDLDYLAGTLFFRRPVPSRSDAFDPVYVVVEYEVLGTGAESTTAGGRATYAALDGRLEVGATFVNEGATAGDRRLGGVDARARFGTDTELRLEAARTDSADPTRPAEGTAYLAEVRHVSEALEGRAYLREQEAGFGLGQQTATEAGTRKFGADGRVRLTDAWSVRAEAYEQRALDTGNRRHLGETELRYADLGYAAGLGLRTVKDVREDVDQRSDQAFGVGTWDVLDGRVQFKAGAELAISGNDDSFDFPDRGRLGADWRFLPDYTAFAEYERARGGTLAQDLTRVGVRAQPWTGGQLETALNDAATENGGRLYSSLGVTQGWRAGERWTFDLGVERTATLRGADVPPLVGVRPPMGGAAADGESTTGAPGGPAAPTRGLPTVGGAAAPAIATPLEDFTAAFVGTGYRGSDWSANARLERREGATRIARCSRSASTGRRGAARRSRSRCGPRTASRAATTRPAWTRACRGRGARTRRAGSCWTASTCASTSAARRARIARSTTCTPTASWMRGRSSACSSVRGSRGSSSTATPTTACRCCTGSTSGAT